MPTEMNAAEYMVQTVAAIAADLVASTGCSTEHATNVAYEYFMTKVVAERPSLALKIVTAMAVRMYDGHAKVC
jgi:hypothetical protein